MSGELVKLGASGANTVNIGAGAGSIEITGLTATDHLNFADAEANATITKVSATEEAVTFADTGQSVDLHFANHAAEVAVVRSIQWSHFV
jgi:hypothetical protein